MAINKATKGRLYPNKTQLHKINLTLSCCRYALFDNGKGNYELSAYVGWDHGAF